MSKASTRGTGMQETCVEFKGFDRVLPPEQAGPTQHEAKEPGCRRPHLPAVAGAEAGAMLAALAA